MRSFCMREMRSFSDSGNVAVAAPFFACTIIIIGGNVFMARDRLARTRRFMRFRAVALAAIFFETTQVAFETVKEGNAETTKSSPCSRYPDRTRGNSFLVSLRFLGITPTSWRGLCGDGASERVCLKQSLSASGTRGFAHACAS